MLKSLHKLFEYYMFVMAIFYLIQAQHGESIVIGLAASSTSKGPQAKTTEPIDSIKAPNCSIQLG